MSLSWWLSLDYQLNTGKEIREETLTVGRWNLTYNLSKMLNLAFEVGPGAHFSDLWINKTAEECEQGVRDAVARMEADPERYKQENPSNGWGTYEVALEHLIGFLEVCREYPRAKVKMHR